LNEVVIGKGVGIPAGRSVNIDAGFIGLRVRSGAAEAIGPKVGGAFCVVVHPHESVPLITVLGKFWLWGTE